MTSSATSMIRWKLREFMARYKVSNRQLGKEIEKHEVSVSRLKQSDSMPRIDGESLNELCHGLTRCLLDNGFRDENGKEKIVTPHDLIEFWYDGEPPASPQEQDPQKILVIEDREIEIGRRSKGFRNADGMQVA